MNWYKIAKNRVISFDFDNTVSKSTWNPDEDDYIRDESGNINGEINKKTEALIRRYSSEGYKVIIVTSRYEKFRDEVVEFVRRYNLPISEIYCTNGNYKKELLEKLGVEMHYDDSKEEIDQLKDSKIRSILVSFVNETYKLAAIEIDLWLDDERDPQNIEIQEKFGAKGNEIWVKTVEEAINYIQQGNVRSISFDNDLGYGNKEGKHLADWIEAKAYNNELKQIDWKIHSQNPIGRKEIYMAMNNADKYWGRNR